MGYLALYRKYRPSNFDDLVGQNSVSSIIKSEILLNKISHAYLFSGPRGTGKTSTAKIIAKMINCEHLSKNGNPCGKCKNCLNFYSSSDIIEIDAASNNGVDEIRDLRDKVNLVPTLGRYKVYIIDEVHMLTTQAFNALLKTLEEPPEHAVFILATTEFYKIPATVISRCQKFQFFKFSNEEIVDRLVKITKLEEIDVSKEILFEIARLSDGGLRDAINMLDQLSSYSDKILLDDLYKLAGVVSYESMFNLFKYIIDSDVKKIVDFVNSLDKEGKNLDRFINDLLFFLKDLLLFKTSSNILDDLDSKKNIFTNLSELYTYEQIYDIIFSINKLSNNMKNSNFSYILLITYFVKLSNDFNNEVLCNNVHDIVLDNKVEDEDVKIEVVDNNSHDDKHYYDNNLDINLKKIRINNSFATASKSLKDDFINKWISIRNLINVDDYKSIIGFIDDLEVLVVGENNIMFMAKYDSLIDRIYNYIDDFEKLLKDVYNIVYKVVIISNDEWIYEKNNYVDKIKNGYKFEYINEFVKDSDKISYDDNYKNSIDKVISLVGEEIIVYE